MKKLLILKSGGLYWLLVLASGFASQGVASTAHIAQPWRADAVVQGRDEAYNTERFLHELTFRHRQPVPSAVNNGIRGTAGSVSSRRLYYDFRFRQDFEFRNQQNAFLLDIQRGEDLDGSYDRQLVGFRHSFREHTEVWIQGDVFSDKAESDIYLSARHHLNERNWLHASWILTDYYFNDKTDTQDRFDTNPQTFFLQWHRQGDTAAEGTTLSVNLTPDTRFISEQEALTVQSDSQKVAFTQRQKTGDWLWSLHMEGERSRRDYALRGPNENTSANFERDHFHARGSVTLSKHRLSPSAGLAYRYLDERGFFGRELNDYGQIQRREPTLFGEITLPVTGNTTISPGLYLSAPDITQSFEDGGSRSHTGFTGKLALPIEVQLSRKDHAVLTFNPTFYLHKAAFGGGNLQLHWPL
ncbi:MAG: hypothetical protein ACQEW7_08355 [Pseudomonadota bacterium]